MNTFNPETHKVCTGTLGCGQLQLRSHFTNDSSRKDGKRAMCKGCQRTARQINKEQKLAANKKYRDKPESRYKTYQRSAEMRGFQWLIGFDDFMSFWKQDCTHCGSAIETIGLDRVNSALPYELGNLESCCRVCNRLKSDMDAVDWYLHMHKIYFHTSGLQLEENKDGQ